MRNSLCAAFLSLTLAGCVSADGYREFYTPVPGLTPEMIARMRAAPPTSKPKVVHLVGRFDQNAQREYWKEGFEVIGFASFTSGRRPDEDTAIDQAQKIGADLIVILGSEYAGSVTTSVPITTPTATTSYTNGMATAYGTGGSAVAFGNSTTTTYGTNTSYVPMTVNRYQYGALYLVKWRSHLGIRDRDLSDQERQALQTNRGVYVVSVVDGSPAYANDILPGDIITAVDGARIDGYANLHELLSARVGQTIELTIIRQGKTISKSVSLQL